MEAKSTTNVKGKLEESKVRMLFNSIDKLMKYYRMYGKKKGFEISKRTLRK